MGKIIKPIIIFALLFNLVFIVHPPKSHATSYKTGDIFITKSTSSKGLTGHTGIAISSKTILHTSGRKGEPYPKTISIKDWNRRHPKTKVIRPKSSSLGSNAASKAKKYFYKKKIPYAITTNPKNIKKTYCSELVWYSYYKAGKNL
ncbi:uncharacterized protein YycO [Scopulibacillus daqui]|uniref:Uncharacterized protein YycO n=1 Tax=Scopulibacillus daqui TaxID=1469162 RepID=A0ABS2Q042_9BACL|nr:hypothetical protein [Scopulibacillus daqui]MBM7645665.1 uncharacterized protein YycO [Scopulibacillus daqui]